MELTNKYEHLYKQFISYHIYIYQILTNKNIYIHIKTEMRNYVGHAIGMKELWEHKKLQIKQECTRKGRRH